MPTRPAPRALLPGVVPGIVLSVVLSLAACGGKDAAAPAWQPSRAPQAQGSLGPGFWDPSAPPAPEATITPAPGSWDAVHPEPGYRVALLVDGSVSRSRAQTAVLRSAVRSWARSVSARLTEYVAKSPADYVATIQAGIDTHPDLVISVGNGLVDPMALVTASNLDTQFLLVGAEIAEPKANVTAADWVGAMYRGEGLGIPERYAPASFTTERAGRALRAGVAAVLSGLTGIVVEVA